MIRRDAGTPAGCQKEACRFSILSTVSGRYNLLEESSFKADICPERIHVLQDFSLLAKVGPIWNADSWSVTVTQTWVVWLQALLHFLLMFLVTEADAVAIRTIFSREGEQSAAIELRRLFPGIADNVKARAHVRAIVGWRSLPTSTAKEAQSSPERVHPAIEGT